MIAYNTTELDNLAMQAEATAAAKRGFITTEEQQTIRAHHPVSLYIPNPVIRIGLYVLTVAIVLLTLGLFVLLGLSGGEDFFGVLSCFVGIAAYGMAEYLVHDRKFYRAGANDALVHTSLVLVMIGIWIFEVHQPVTLGFLTCALSVYLALRFADMLLSVVAFAALLFTVVEIMIPVSPLLTPIVTMIFSAAVYLLTTRQVGVAANRHYALCLQVVSMAALLALYGSGNYLVIEAVSEHYALPALNIFYWITTLALPLLYIAVGVSGKNRILLRTGLLLVAAAVLTVRQYYHVAPIEVVMLISGILMTGVAYALLRYLKQPRHGFTAEEDDEPDALDRLQAESLVIAETFTPAAKDNNSGMNFGGGSGGGGGASGSY